VEDNLSRGEESENKNLAYYRQRFENLNVGNKNPQDRSPNQPILLLSVIDLITQSLLKDNHITISEKLINTFKKNWSALTSDSFKPVNFAIPFFHLNKNKPKFWHVKFSEQYAGGRAQTINTLKRDVDSVKLDDELFNLLQDTNVAKELIDVLISTWFSSNQKPIEHILTINQSLQHSPLNELDIIELGNTDRQPKVYLRKSLVREGIFRKAIVQLYDYRCAFCRLKVTRSLSQTIVDGAHIKPFSEFYDSRPNNGLSLCKNHHWAFDRGWFAINDHYQIIVASDVEEESPRDSRSMKDFHGEIILLPSSEENYPRIDAIQWHRKNVFTLKSQRSYRK
jgi:putative restriction endonuclease